MEGSLVAYKVFTNGSVLNASEINDNLMNQSVMVFSNSTARAAALTAPVEGMLTWLQDTDKYEYYSGAGAWVELVSSPTWTSFTPTWTNLTVGNGTYTSSSYSLNGKIAQVNIRLVFGSTTSISGDVSFTVPAAITRKVATTPSNNFLLLGDVPTSNFVGNVISSSLSATSFLLRVSLANTTYTNLDAISATVPHTWGTSDVISLAMTYEVA
jgi:hypothetical protein